MNTMLHRYGPPTLVVFGLILTAFAGIKEISLQIDLIDARDNLELAKDEPRSNLVRVEPTRRNPYGGAMKVPIHTYWVAKSAVPKAQQRLDHFYVPFLSLITAGISTIILGATFWIRDNTRRNAEILASRE